MFRQKNSPWIYGIVGAAMLAPSLFPPPLLQAQTPPLPDAPSLVALWDFGGIDPDGRIPDRGPLGLDGRVHGRWERVAAPAGQAVRFSGDTAFIVDPADELNPGKDPWIVEVWGRPRVAGGTMPFLSKWAADHGVRILWTASGGPDDHPVLHYRMHLQDGPVRYSAPGYVGVRPEFTHLLTVFDRGASNAAVFRDGQPVTVRHGSDNLDSVGRVVNEAPLRIETGFIGDVARLALYRGTVDAEMADVLHRAARAGDMPYHEMARRHETIQATDGLKFDGRRDRIRVPHHPDLNPGTENWTVAFQVQILEPLVREDRTFLAKRDGNGGAGFSVGTRFTAVCNEGGEQAIDFRPHLTVYHWHDVAVQIDRQQEELRVFVNGTLVKQQELVLSGALDAESDLVMGGNSAGRLNGHPCMLREVRIWKGILPTPRPNPDAMSWAPAYDAAGLVAHWPLRDGTGQAVRDLAGDHTGHIAGDPEWQTRFFDRNLAGQVVRAGQTVTLGPVALHQPRGTVRHQWFFEGQAIEGATGETLVIENIAPDAFGTYHAELDDARHMTPVSSRTVHVGEADWPMWQFDAARSADPPQQLSGDLHLQWVRELPAPRRAWAPQQDDLGKLDFDVAHAPVAAGGRLFVPSSVTDSVTAYRLEDGAELWRFYADGPVRLAPAVWRHRVYFVSDDGFLYCTDARTGEMLWKFRGGPSDHRLLGNERIINVWAARGGPVIQDGIVYFAAGIWPLHGIFIHALDAASGQAIWVNDTTSSDYVDLPHGGASGYGGLAPQGYLAATRDRLIVAGGRGTPAFLSRPSGQVIHYDGRGRYKGEGGYAVHGIDGGGIGLRHNTMLAQHVAAISDVLDHDVLDALTAGNRLVVSTVDGSLYGFGPDAAEPPVRHAYTPAGLAPRDNDDWAGVVETLLNPTGDTGGYGLMLGAGSGELLRELLARSDLHIVVVESDPEIVRALRDEFAAGGLYGRRAAVIEAPPASFSVQPYLFSLIASEDAEAAGLDPDAAGMAALLDRLRPYGGVAWLGASGSFLARMVGAAATANVDQVSIQSGHAHFLARRAGPLSGAGEWTHQYQDSANTLLSRDQRVRLPLGVLWFGGPGNDNVLPRWGLGPRPQVSGGRQVFLGVETIAARCVYTGRALWEREFPGIGHPYTRERGGPGSNVRWTAQGAYSVASPFVTLPDAVYVRHDGRIYRLDPANGENVSEFSLPGRPLTEIYPAERIRRIGIGAPDRGHVSVWGRFLVATAEPHLFEGQIPGQPQSYSGTSSRRLAVLDRFSGATLWSRTARIGFRHYAIVSGNGTLYVIDGLSENALQFLARRGQVPDEPSIIMALDLQTGAERWRTESDVFGTFLLYSEAHDLLVEGGTFGRHPLDDEIERNVARSGQTGTIQWESGAFTLPAALHGDRLIAGRHFFQHGAVSIRTGQTWPRTAAVGAETHPWRYTRRHGCSTVNASPNLLLFRTAYAGFYDLEHETGTGNFSGFRSGCTPNLIAADGVLNALDYTRTCICSYGLQTSLALVHMPDDANLEVWTRYQGDPRDPGGFGINFGAPGRRVDERSGRIWHPARGFRRRHASAMTAGDSLPWIASSGHEFIFEEHERVALEPATATRYRLRLHFAELDARIRPGQRVFDVYINDRPILEGFDIVEAAGGPLRGMVKTVLVTAGDPGEVLTLRRARGSTLFPLLNGLEWMPAEDTAPTVAVSATP